jgi:two-component system, response regulator PdtaR
MRALRVIIADAGLMARSDVVQLCERANLDVVGEAVDWNGVAEVIASRAADLVLTSGDPDFARGATGTDTPTIALAPDALAAKGYADCGVFAVVTPTMEPEMIASMAHLAVARGADLAAVRSEADKLRDQLETRKLVERAKGVLMQRLGVTEEAAYKKMQRASQDENRRMRDIAESILSAERLYAEPKPE